MIAILGRHIHVQEMLTLCGHHRPGPSKWPTEWRVAAALETGPGGRSQRTITRRSWTACVDIQCPPVEGQSQQIQSVCVWCGVVCGVVCGVWCVWSVCVWCVVCVCVCVCGVCVRVVPNEQFVYKTTSQQRPLSFTHQKHT